MPVSPDDASNLAKAMLELYSSAEERLLQIIARRLARNIDSPSWADRQLLSVQGLLTETRALTLQLRAEGKVTFADIIRTAFNRGAALAGTDLTAAGVARGIAFGGVNTQAVSALIRSNQGILTPIGPRIVSSAGQIFRDVVQQTAAAMLTGSATRRQASAQALGRFAQAGITGFQDTAGRNWSLTTYAEMAARTAGAQAIVQGHVEQLQAAGFDLVAVSDAPEECVRCRPWEGKVLSLSGATKTGLVKRDGTLFRVSGTLAQATKDGLFHPNCRHRTTLFTPGVTKLLHDTADPEGDALRQKQRAYERRVRELKRVLIVQLELDPRGPGAIAAKAKLKAKTAEFKTWREDNGRKNLAYRTSATFR